MVDDSEWEDRIGRAEERYLQMCIEQDEGTVGEWNGY